ncbi:MAG TPA: enolase C-terminal domain-like protein [Myxococcaceae bacterium]|nr:enolase C-terminal domain-like protein [Myxococcaceae bacterium]
MVAIERVEARAYEIPTEGGPEADGTLEWRSTTLVVAHVWAGGLRGLGYTYADAAAADVINRVGEEELKGEDVLDVPARMVSLLKRVRNKGRPGLVAMALSAVDAALWDTKARLLNVPLVKLLGAARERVPVYGSGGFTSYSEEKLREQMAGWAEEGIERVKMKVGSHPEEDVRRVKAAREATGPGVELFVDGNGAYTTKQALALAERFGEYGWDAIYFRRMLGAGAVDVLQADATRCLGVTGFLQVDALCEGFQVPLSAHCAPSLHVHACCAARNVVHLEYFHDHVRIERMLFDGAPRQEKGELAPDLTRPGLGLELKRVEAEKYEV